MCLWHGGSKGLSIHVWWLDGILALSPSNLYVGSGDEIQDIRLMPQAPLPTDPPYWTHLITL